MSHETRLFALRRLRDEIRAETKTRALAAEGTHDPALAAKVDRWIQQVAAAQKQIKSGHHLNALQFEQMRFAADRSARHSAAQRFRSRDANLAALQRATVEVAQALGALLAQKGAEKNDLAKAVEAIGKSLEKIMKSIDTGATATQDFGLGQQEQTITASVRQLERTTGTPTGTAAGLPVIDLFTLILAYFAMIKAMRR
ncbi:glycoside hydrolase family 127 protein [Oceaniglobus trochenteri]|uniref:glycoside hydrolase family 127 protein n=1 Tax=Oceaniglobus trochenteri TaxID=2763260 RepID=UPI001CFFBD35|nr:glycoside hydrolase family 127 protein [Oceaniglobus trochenteri]